MSNDKTIIVNISPSSVIDFARWRIESSDSISSWFDSGISTNIDVGEYTVVGETITGWTIQTNNIKLTVTEDIDAYTLQLEYIEHGNLKIKILDDGAKTLARWKPVLSLTSLTSGTSGTSGTGDWFSDGEEIDLTPNSYEIEFNEITNYVKPSDLTVGIVKSETAVRTVTYIAYGMLQVNITVPNESSITEIARWRIKNNSDTVWKISGYNLNLAPGIYTVEFNSVDNTYTYPDITVTIVTGVLNEQDIIFEGMKLLAIPTKDNLYTYNYNNFQRQDLLDTSLTNINQVAFNSSGTLLAIASNSSPYLIIYNCIDYEILNDIIVKPVSGCRSICFSPDNNYLTVSQNISPYITVYNTNDWSEVTVSNQPTSYCSSLIFNSTSQKLIAGYDTSPYLSMYNVSGGFTNITIDTSELDSVLSLKYNTSDLLVGCQSGVYVYNDSNILEDQSSFDNINGSINGIEIIGTKIIIVTGSSLYVYEFGNTYSSTTVSLPVKSNVNTWIKTDSDGDYLLIGGLRTPGLLVYDTSDWSLVDLADEYQYCKKFDISNDMSSRSFVRTPSNVTPLDDTKGIYNITNIVTDDFEYYNTDSVETHTSTHWRILDSTGSLVLNDIINVDDVGFVTGSLTSIPIPTSLYNDVNTYTWQVKYEGSISGWSFWSTPTSFITAYSYITKPVNSTPSDSETSVIETLTLTASTFTPVNLTDTHTKSQWKIYNKTTSVLIYDSGMCNDLTSHTLIFGLGVQAETEYTWQVCYKGNLIGNSDWSDLTTFTTGVWGVTKPVNISPSEGQIDVNANQLLLKSNNFLFTGSTSTHTFSRWEIYDSIEDDAIAIRISGEIAVTGSGVEYTFIPNEYVTNGINTYYWRVAYKGSAYEQWSDWSTKTSFITKALDYATVLVHITPSEILSGRTTLLGWRWKLATDSEFSGPYILPEVLTSIESDKTINIEFESYSSYATPSQITTYLKSGQSYEFSVLYQPVSGSIKVDLTPNSGLWKIQGRTSWKPSGHTENNLPYDTYDITYSNLISYETPSPAEVTVDATTPTPEITASYILSTNQYSLKVICDPSTGYWQLGSGDSSVWWASGEAISLFEITTDTIIFSDIYQKTTPSNISLTVPDDYATYPDLEVINQIKRSVTYQDIDACTLTVNLNVSTAHWSITGGSSSYITGYTTTLSAGSYNIECEDVTGYITPFDKVVTINAGEDKIVNINYTEIGNSTIKINITPSTVQQVVKYRSRYSSDNGVTWSEWSTYINYTTSIMTTTAVAGIYKIQVKSTNPLYTPETGTKTITYENGIKDVNFKFIGVIPEPESIIINITPGSASDNVETIEFQYTDSDGNIGSWTTLEKEE
ncbi:WD40 repeat domain-containing protein [archaeon]|mgnify:CR=1 FL=1|jgi:hypothetical protein|nr:WD40 repeat domain-containing protein [archaeon]